MRDSASGIVAAEVLPEVDDVAGDDRRWAAPSCVASGVDDAQVGLVRDERGEVARARRRRGGRPRGATGRHRRGGPAVDGLALLAEEAGLLVDGDGVGLLAVAAPDDRAEPGLVGRADDRGAGAVAEDDAGAAVVHVQPAGEPLRGHDQHVAGLAGLHGGRGGVQGVDEARSSRS